MALKTLATRERILIAIAILIFAAILLPTLNRFANDYRNAKRQAHDSVLQLEEIRFMRELILEDRRGQEILRAKIAQRKPNFDLYSHINKTVREIGIQQLVTLKSGGSMAGVSIDAVDLDLRGVNMKQLIDLMHSLYESDNLITLKSLGSLRPAPGNKGLNCTMTLISPRATRTQS